MLDGPASNAELSYPAAVAVDSAGNFYIADVGNSRIRKYRPPRGIIPAGRVSRDSLSKH